MRLLIILSIVFGSGFCFAQPDTTKTEPSVKDSSSLFRQSGRQHDMLIDPDIEASYPGGPVAMLRYIDTWMIYPEDALKEKVQGRVYLSFVIEPDGSLSNIKVEKSLYPSLDKEAVRIVNSMPRWNPGRVSGELTRTRCRLPIVFEIEKEDLKALRRKKQKRY